MISAQTLRVCREGKPLPTPHQLRGRLFRILLEVERRLASRRNVRFGSIATELAVRAMSGLPPIATKLRTSREVRFVPIPEVAALFDHLVSALLEQRRHVQTERLRSFEIDGQHEINWGLDGKVARLLALENAISGLCCAPKIINR